MSERQIILDTETTGLELSQGHRIIEIGCVEMINRKLTGNNFHEYINPERDIEAGALAVHGITEDFLLDKPHFEDVAESLMKYLKGAELVIHNASFDVGFLNMEFEKTEQGFTKINSICTIYDTLIQARKMFPGQRNNLDSLCKRFEVDNSHRDLHGALLDAEILADVYLGMTGGQTNLLLESNEQITAKSGKNGKSLDLSQIVLPVLQATAEEKSSHAEWVNRLNEAVDGKCVWTRLSERQALKH